MPKLNPAYLAALYHQIRHAPYPRLVSMRLTLLELDRAEIEMDAGDQHLQPFGILHGGVIATLIDTATFWAGFGPIPADAGLVNVDLKLNYLQAAKPGRLLAEGRLLRAGRTINYAEASVKAEDGSLIAHGTSTLMVLPGKGLANPFPKFLDD